jgi:hypothetical protein
MACHEPQLFLEKRRPVTPNRYISSHPYPSGPLWISSPRNTPGCRHKAPISVFRQPTFHAKDRACSFCFPARIIENIKPEKREFLCPYFFCSRACAAAPAGAAVGRASLLFRRKIQVCQGRGRNPLSERGVRLSLPVFPCWTPAMVNGRGAQLRKAMQGTSYEG